MATTYELKTPIWVPSAVREQVLDLIHPRNEREWTILKRLLSDRRMKRVWNELTKHKRSFGQSAEEPYYKPRERTIVGPSKVTLDDALKGLIHVAYDLAANPVSSMTHDEAMRAYEDLADIGKRLSDDAMLIKKQFKNPQIISIFMLWQHSPDFSKKHFSREKVLAVPDYIVATHELARFFDDALTRYTYPILEKPSFYYFRPEGERRPLVRRRTGNDRTRAYVLQLAKTCKNLFDLNFYGIVAVISSVALQKKITAAYVRKVVNQ